MTDHNLIERLLDRWQDEVDACRTPDLKSLCADHPELIPELQNRIAVFQKMDRGLKKILCDTMPPSGILNDDDRDSAVSIGNPLINATVRYRVRSKHAKGGLGEVLIAEDEVLGRQVALKRMQGDAFRDPVRRQRFHREAVITGKLDHPGVVAVHSLGEDAAGSPCYAMKFVEGQSLDQYARELHESFTRRTGHDLRDRRLFESAVLRPLLSRFVSVCNTIAFAHSRNVIHRDIKPANVMLGDFGATYVVDWGLAKYESPRSTSDVVKPPIVPQTNETIPAANSATANSRKAATVMRDSAAANGDSIAADVEALLDDALTRTGSVMGTPAYMSPEQANGDSGFIGPASDIYSLGATLYFILTVRAPIASSGDMNWIDQVRRGQFPRPREVQPLIPAGLESICLNAMTRNPSDRYSSAVELAADVERWLADEPLLAHPENLSAIVARFTRRHRAWTQAAVIGLILITILSGAFAVELNERRKRAEAAEQANLQLAKEKSVLADSEAAARKIAEEQGSLTLATLRSVVFQISRKLTNVEGASAIRMQLLETAVNGLSKVATALNTRVDADRNLMVAHNDIGKIYMSVGSLDKVNTTTAALEQFQKAMEIGEQLKAELPDDDSLDRDMSVALELIGDAQMQLGELSKADEAYAQSLSISEVRLKSSPKELLRQQDTGFGYEKVGDIRMARGDVAEAKKLYSRSLEIYQEIVGSDPGNASYQRDLLVARSKMGNIQRQEGQLEEAAATFRECVSICEALEKLAGSDAERRDRSVLLNKLGTVLLEQEKLEEAEKTFETSLQIARDAVVLEPTSVLGRRDLTISLMHTGSVGRKQGNHDKALMLLQECLTLRRTLASEDASSQVAQIDVASVLTELGDINIAVEQNDAARMCLTEAATILTGLKDAGKLQGAEDQNLLERVLELQTRLTQ